MAEHVRTAGARRAKRGFLAFLVIVAYGGFIGKVDVGPAKHPTLLFWFWTVLIGFVAYVLVAGLLRDDE